MTDPKRFIFLRNNSGFTLNYQASLAQRSYRCFAGANSNLYMIPQVEAWPHATDTNGVAYPGSGLVAVRGKFNYAAVEATNDTTEDYIIGVPSEPDWSLYTPRWYRDHNHRPSGNNLPLGGSGQVGQATPFNTVVTTGTMLLGPRAFPNSEPALSFLTKPYRVRTDQALTSYYWMPECFCNNAGVSAIPVPGLTGGNRWTSRQYAGFRYLRFVSSGTAGVGGNIQLRCNVDGTNTGTGDTLLWSTPVTTPYDTGVLFHDGITNTLYSDLHGTKKFFYFSAPYLSLVYMGPRLDIPLPYTATGPNDLIAPGGIVPGSVPGF